MKRVINLIHLGPAVIITIGLFCIVVPELLYGLSLLLDAAHRSSVLVHRLMMGSLAVGGILLAAFVLLLIIEQVQDAVLYQVYRKGRGKRLPLADGYYECQFCGCRTLRDFDHTCPVCGKALQ